MSIVCYRHLLTPRRDSHSGNYSFHQDAEIDCLCSCKGIFDAEAWEESSWTPSRKLHVRERSVKLPAKMVDEDQVFWTEHWQVNFTLRKPRYDVPFTKVCQILTDVEKSKRLSMWASSLFFETCHCWTRAFFYKERNFIVDAKVKDASHEAMIGSWPKIHVTLPSSV